MRFFTIFTFKAFSKFLITVMTPFFNKRQNDLNFKLKIVAEAEAVKNNREIAREYGIFKSMVHKWENQQHMLFNGK